MERYFVKVIHCFSIGDSIDWEIEYHEWNRNTGKSLGKINRFKTFFYKYFSSKWKFDGYIWFSGNSKIGLFNMFINGKLNGKPYLYKIN